MKQTLTELLKECIRDAKSGRGGGLDPNKYPSQILCLAEMVQFTERCEEALKTHNLPNFHREMEQQLESYTRVDISSSGKGDTEAHVLDLKLKVILKASSHLTFALASAFHEHVKFLSTSCKCKCSCEHHHLLQKKFECV